MSHQNLADAFESAEFHYREKVMQSTWGHLAPKKNRIYRGHLVFAVGCFGSDPLNPIVLSCEFPCLDSSPWFFDSMAEFIGNIKTDEGCVYRFDGTFRNYEFNGTVRTLLDARQTT